MMRKTRVNSVRFVVPLGLAGLALVLPAGGERPVASPVRYSVSNVAVLRTALGGKANAAAETTAVAEPTGWGTLKGAFKIVGTPPSPSQINITSDHAVCMPGG